MLQFGLFDDEEAARRRAIVEKEKLIIANYESQQVLATEIWVVLRNPRPISINKAYSGKQRFLTKEGRNFEDHLRGATAAALGDQPIAWKHVVDSVYKQGGRCALQIWLYMDDLLNEAWKVGGGKTKEGNPRSPYKKKDGSNYIKLIEDAVVKGTGIDDSAHLDASIGKREDKLDPRIVINYRVYE